MGSAKGVVFITIEDETGVAKVVIWPSRDEQQRRIVLSSSLLAVDGKVQRRARSCISSRPGSRTVRTFSRRSATGAAPSRSGMVVATTSIMTTRRTSAGPALAAPRRRAIYSPDLSLDVIKVKTRDFR